MGPISLLTTGLIELVVYASCDSSSDGSGGGGGSEQVSWFLFGLIVLFILSYRRVATIVYLYTSEHFSHLLSLYRSLALSVSCARGHSKGGTSRATAGSIVCL